MASSSRFWRFQGMVSDHLANVAVLLVLLSSDNGLVSYANVVALWNSGKQKLVIGLLL